MENQQDPNQNYLNFQSSLPNSTPVLVLGIISIPGCFCYGLGIVFGIIALVLAKKDLLLYNTNPSVYNQSSYNNLKAGRICAIIGVILSAIYILFIILVLVLVGAAALTNPDKIFQNM